TFSSSFPVRRSAICISKTSISSAICGSIRSASFSFQVDMEHPLDVDASVGLYQENRAGAASAAVWRPFAPANSRICEWKRDGYLTGFFFVVGLGFSALTNA